MNRIDRIFSDLRVAGGKALMPFITAGDPNLGATGALLMAMQRAGASICELGIPFSDPIADGPVIQSSMTHALEQGVGPMDVLAMVAQLRSELDMGLVAMVSYSIVHRLGAGRFIRDAKAAGIDGFIFPDLPLAESQMVRDLVLEQDLICSMLIAPTTPVERAEQIARSCSGFIYLLSRAGITGEQAQIADDLAVRISRLRGVTDLPIAVGFGISDPAQVSQVVTLADAAIVGSAIMRRVALCRDGGVEQLVQQVETFVRELAGGLEGG